MSADDFKNAPCVGRSELFDSTDLFAHIEARKLCESCPVRLACARLLTEIQTPETEGTWAGRLLERKRSRRAQFKRLRDRERPTEGAA